MNGTELAVHDSNVDLTTFLTATIQGSSDAPILGPNYLTEEQAQALSNKALALLEEGLAMQAENIEQERGRLDRAAEVVAQRQAALRGMRSSGMAEHHVPAKSITPSLKEPERVSTSSSSSSRGNITDAVLQLIADNDGGEGVTTIIITELAFVSDVLNPDGVELAVFKQRMSVRLSYMSKTAGLLRNIGQSRQACYVLTDKGRKRLGSQVVARKTSSLPKRGGAAKPQSKPRSGRRVFLPKAGTNERMVLEALKSHGTYMSVDDLATVLAKNRKYNPNCLPASDIRPKAAMSVSNLCRKKLVASRFKNGSNLVKEYTRTPEADASLEDTGDGESDRGTKSHPPPLKSRKGSRRSIKEMSQDFPRIDIKQLPQKEVAHGIPNSSRDWGDILEFCIEHLPRFDFRALVAQNIEIRRKAGYSDAVMSESVVENGLQLAVSSFIQVGVISLGEDRCAITVVRQADGEDDDLNLDDSIDAAEDDEQDDEPVAVKQTIVAKQRISNGEYQEIASEDDWLQATREACSHLGSQGGLITFSDVISYVFDPEESGWSTNGHDEVLGESQISDALGELEGEHIRPQGEDWVLI